MADCFPIPWLNSIFADLFPLGGIEHGHERSDPIHIVIVGNPVCLGVTIKAGLKVHKPMRCRQNRP